MKLNTKILALLTSLLLVNVHCAFAIKTDPVLKDPKGMISIKTDPVLNPRNELLQGYSSNLQSVMDLIAAFEKTGAKVSTNLVENKGVTVLEVSINGNKTTPFVVKCLDCEVIVFEY